MIENHRRALAPRSGGREDGIATEYVVIMILVALTAILVLANYGRDVGNQVDAAGGKIDTLGARDPGDESGPRRSGGGGTGSGGGPAGAAGGEARGGDASAPPPRAHGGPSGHKDGSGQPLPESAAEAAPPPQGSGATRQLVIGGIILAAVGLLVAVRISQGMRRMGEDRQKKAEEALREERNREVDEDTLNVKRSEIFGEEEEGKEDR